MCVVCKLDKVVEQLIKITLKKQNKDDRTHAAQALAAAHLVQAAQAVLCGELELVSTQVEKAQEIIDIDLDNSLEEIDCLTQRTESLLPKEQPN